ncbi:MAG: nucleoside deaminase [Clostridiales bacterium]|jgi:tRNA(adenine34) deaminase|nr:nucleoside deaminase [Clostridiales bacterium]
MVFDGIICSNDDERYMLEALREAASAASQGEVPVGAVIVRDGQIIARAGNRIETGHRSSAHAEMLAIEAAEAALDAKWLTGCTMYVTLEPCSMCAGAMVLARLDRLVIGTDDPKTGACGSLYNIAGDGRLNHRIEIERGVLRDSCSELLKEFFRERRG